MYFSKFIYILVIVSLSDILSKFVGIKRVMVKKEMILIGSMNKIFLNK